MVFSIAEIKKKTDGIIFEEQLEIKEDLMRRNPEIIDIQDVIATGKVSYEQGLYLLQYHLTYRMILPSSRSMEPVELLSEDDILESFIEADYDLDHQDMVDSDLVLIIEGQSINLRESVMDNILLNIPLRVLTSAEEAEDQLPSGQDWSVLTQEQYQAQQEEKQRENNPFVALDGIFEE